MAARSHHGPGLPEGERCRGLPRLHRSAAATWVSQARTSRPVRRRARVENFRRVRNGHLNRSRGARGDSCITHTAATQRTRSAVRHAFPSSCYKCPATPATPGGRRKPPCAGARDPRAIPAEPPPRTAGLHPRGQRRRSPWRCSALYGCASPSVAPASRSRCQGRPGPAVCAAARRAAYCWPAG